MSDQALYVILAVALVVVVTLAVFLSRNAGGVRRDNTVGRPGGGYAGAAYTGHPGSNDNCGPGDSGSCDSGGGGDGGGGGGD